LHGSSNEEIDAFLLHQANLFMLKHIGKKAKIPVDRMPVNINDYGNTSSASIPLLLTTVCRERVAARAARLLLAGFGVGYSWAAAIVDLRSDIYVQTVTM
jgi:3-oxoacyl-[acyl-carrier-protein] synthase-3